MLPWVICGIFGLIVLVDAGMWLAAQAGAQPGWLVPGVAHVPDALREHGMPGLIGPHGSPAWFWTVCGFEAATLAALGVVIAAVAVRTKRVPDGQRALTHQRGFTELQQPAVTKRAQGLAPSLANTPSKEIDVRRIGARLGSIQGRLLFKSLEDVEVVLCGPRSNKTSAKVVPEILAAPGPVIATSNKPDVWLLTAALRSRVGPVFTFDAQHLTYQEQSWWWDPLVHVVDVESAARMAGYFMREVGANASGGTNRADPFFTPAAAKTLRQLLLAAACGGYTLRDVVLWIATRSDEPAAHLERGGFPAQAASLRSTLELPVETRGGIYEGVSTAVSCLDSEALLRWVTPPDTWEHPPDRIEPIAKLDLWQLLTPPGARHPSLYLLSREGEGSGRPIVAALIGELIQVSVHAATAQGGRLDPVVTLPLDECANIVRLPELPSWMSWFGSMGLSVTVVLQSREQGRATWGREGFDALWSAATIKTVGAGLADPDFAEDLSRLVGDHKVEETSTSYSAGGHSSSRSLRTERILTAADIAALDRSKALLFTSGRRPGLLTLHPWYAEPDEDQDIAGHARAATEQVKQAAIDYLGPDNPVAAHLREGGRGD
ncbi:type IV secretory system conjugative DNA transfer family protein [Sciscionella marina]|uniref:type IV secretory system conjugative DNA transfer family protein n=1 Tax=Sciscionella marina TaxID=508770 RepID=UPI001F08DEC1|nr:type IV secretory system conjugative DNA transfer family protein [Sciscionella marina]